MLLTITTTLAPATDLGYLLHKHPERVQSFGVSAGGTAHVFYPEACAERCTPALLLEVDPAGLVRGGGEGITHYVNDRPYAASSLLAVALKEVFRTALTGRCEARPELAATAIPLEIWVPALRCAGGAEPANLSRLRSRAVGRKRSLALREYALGLEALDRGARGEALRRVHECVFGVLALESEPVDPRL